MDSDNIISFPSQKKTRAQKTQTWAKSCVRSVDSLGILHNDGTRKYRKNKLINYYLYNGIVDKRDMELTINPYDTIANYIPDEIPHYPIAAPKIDLLVGEEARRRFDYKVVVTNPDAISDKEEKLKEQWTQKLVEIISMGNPTKDAVEKMLKKHEVYLKQSWQDIREKTANNILRHYFNEYNMPYMFNQGFKDALITGEEIYEVDILSNEPIIRKLNPLQVHTVRSSGSSWIQDSDIIVIEDYWSPGKIVDNFFEHLKPDQITKIEKGVAGGSDGDTENPLGGAIHDQPNLFVQGSFVQDVINLSEVYGHTYGKPSDTNGNIRVLKVLWKSFRKIKKVTYFDEDGDEQVDFFPEDYIIDEDAGEMEKVLWVTEWWEGTKIGSDIYIKMRPKPIQYNSIDNPSKCHPGIVGLVYNTNELRSVSMMDRMKQYQYLYDAMKDRLNKTMAKYLGPLMELDLAKVPENWGVEKWLHFAVSNGIAVVDSFKEGNKGAATGKLAGGMNTTGKVLNIELGNYIQQHVNMLEYIKADMAEIVGISKQREGQISSRETVGGVERSVNQSSHITEEYFLKHELVKTEVMKAFLETAKVALKGKSKKVQYILGDDSIAILSLEGDNFSEADYGILVSINNKYQEIDQMLKQLAHAGIQNDKMDFSTLMSIYMSDSLSDIRRRIEQKEEEKDQATQQQMQAEQQMKQAELQQKEKEAAEKFAHEDRLNMRDNETKLQDTLLKIQADMAGTDVDNDGLSDELELIKHKDNIAMKIKELQQAMQQHNDKMQREDKKIAKMNKNKSK